MKRCLLLVVLCVLMLPTKTAQAHDLGINSVDLNRELLYYDDTNFDGALAYAVAAWNDVDTQYGGRGVALREVPSRDEATVIVTNKDLDGTYAGWYEGDTASVDYIYLDRKRLENYSRGDRRRLLEHEIGHALGFNHNDLQDTSIMYPCPACTTLTAPGPHDLSDYYASWVLGSAVPLA